MVPSSAGAVVLIPFPFPDLSQSKLRPAIALARANVEDWVLCQVTSAPYGDTGAIPIDPGDLRSGSLKTASSARPGKLFTASHRLIQSEVGVLTDAALTRLRDAVCRLIQGP